MPEHHTSRLEAKYKDRKREMGNTPRRREDIVYETDDEYYSVAELRKPVSIPSTLAEHSGIPQEHVDF